MIPVNHLTGELSALVTGLTSRLGVAVVSEHGSHVDAVSNARTPFISTINPHTAHCSAIIDNVPKAVRRGDLAFQLQD